MRYRRQLVDVLVDGFVGICGERGSASGTLKALLRSLLLLAIPIPLSISLPIPLPISIALSQLTPLLRTCNDKQSGIIAGWALLMGTRAIEYYCGLGTGGTTC